MLVNPKLEELTYIFTVKTRCELQQSTKGTTEQRKCTKAYKATVYNKKIQCRKYTQTYKAGSGATITPEMTF